MYCSNCGTRLPDDAVYCPACGAAQDGSTRREKVGHPLSAAFVILAFFPPILGLIPLWILAPWRRDTKLAVSLGLMPPIVPQLWGPVIWRQQWTRELRVLAVAAIFLGDPLLLGYVAGFTAGLIAWITTILVLVVWVLVARGRAEPQAGETARQRIEGKLDACDDLIAEIEHTVALDLLPAGSPVREHYVRALEMRSEGFGLLQRASTERELVAADRAITRALQELRATRDLVDERG